MKKKVIDITERVPAMREQRKKRTNIKFILLTASFLFIIALLLYFQTSYSDLKEIVITGEEIVGEKTYLKQSGLVLNDSMWSFKVSEIEQQFEEFDWVKTAKVKRELLNTVNITIEEWQKVAYISKDGMFYPMLENGVILDESNELVPIDAPIFLKFDNEGLRKKLLKELAKLDDEVLVLISQINSAPTEADPYAITLFMNDGYEVRAEITSLASKLNYYPSIIAQIESDEAYEKGIIDIEVGSYYRPFTDEYVIISDQLENAEGQQNTDDQASEGEDDNADEASQ